MTGLANDDGEVVERYTYGPFGELLEGDPQGKNPFRYCGEYVDIETGSIYLRARIYTPANGRFTQEDPAQDGTNWYVYCANDPVNFTDPSGFAYVALRSLVEDDLGGTVKWDAKTNTATVTVNGRTTPFTGYYNPRPNRGSTTPFIGTDGRLYVDDMTFYKKTGTIAYDYKSDDGIRGKVVFVSEDTALENVTAPIGNNDFLVRDLRRRAGNNPAVEIRDCNKVQSKKQRYAVIDILLLLEAKDPAGWERTRDSLEFEFWYHAFFTEWPIIGERGRDAMLDNAAE